MPIVLGVILCIIGLYIMYLVVKAAIDNSKVTGLLIEIRDILIKQDFVKKAIDIDEAEDSKNESRVICSKCRNTFIPHGNNCPYCGHPF